MSICVIKKGKTMKSLFLLLGILPLLSAPALAVTDLSGLYGKSTEPNIKNIAKDLKSFKNTIKYIKLNVYQKKALAKLDNSLKATATSATLKRVDSRGPNWKAKAISYMNSKYDV